MFINQACVLIPKVQEKKKKENAKTRKHEDGHVGNATSSCTFSNRKKKSSLSGGASVCGYWLVDKTG